MKYAYRLSPCPAYNVADTEGWLSDMAERGLMLSENGFFGGLAVFDKAEPRSGVRYRMEAAPKGTSMWSDDNGLPEREQRDMMADAGWEYVCNRGDFYIYRTDRPDAAEPNTDPAVQALTLDAVVKRRKGSLFTAIFYLIGYPILISRAGLVAPAIEMGTAFVGLIALLLTWSAASALREYLTLSRLLKALRRGEMPPHRDNWRKKAARHRAAGIIYIAAVLAVVVMAMNVMGDNVLDEDKIALEDYNKPLPFGELSRLFDGDFTDSGLRGYDFNSVKEWSDILAPRCIKLAQSGDVKGRDGVTRYGSLRVSYYEVGNDFIAGLLASELERFDRLERPFSSDYYTPYEMEKPDCDDFYSYNLWDFQQTVVIRKGNIVLRAEVVNIGEQSVDFEVWVHRLIDSI